MIQPCNGAFAVASLRPEGYLRRFSRSTQWSRRNIAMADFGLSAFAMFFMQLHFS
jgi:hypothetical protein